MHEHKLNIIYISLPPYLEKQTLLLVLISMKIKKFQALSPQNSRTKLSPKIKKKLLDHLVRVVWRSTNLCNSPHLLVNQVHD